MNGFPYVDTGKHTKQRGVPHHDTLRSLAKFESGSDGCERRSVEPARDEVCGGISTFLPEAWSSRQLKRIVSQFVPASGMLDSSR